MPIPIKNGLSYPKTKIIYGDTRNKIQNQSSVPPIDFHAKTGLAVEYSISGNMTQASTQEYSITDIPPIDFQSDGSGLSDYSIYGNMVQATSQQYSLTGTSPLSFKSDANTLSAWSIAGNMTQTGTPTPDAPIMPTFCGVMTANLIDESKVTPNAYITNYGITGSSTFSNLTDYTDINALRCALSGVRTIDILSPGTRALCYFDSDKNFISGTVYDPDVMARPVSLLNIPQNARYVRFTFDKAFENGIMLNLGSTALPYEPFGWKIPITNGGQTVTAYLAEPIRKIGDYADLVDSSGVVTRSIKKLVLTGEENWIKFVNNNRASFYINVGDGTGTEFISTHFHKSLSPNFPDLNSIIYNGNTNKNMVFRMSDDTTITEVDDFKTYLAAQYAAGTPVTVWYVLSTPETETFTAPTIPTTTGDNTLSIDTTLSPSSVSITTTSGVWPENPIIPEETGDRTANLFEYTLENFVYSRSNGSVITSNRYVSTDKKPVMSLSEMTISFNCPKEGTTASSDPDCFVYFWQDTTYLGYAQQYTKELVNVQIPPNATHFAFSVGAGSGGVLYIDDITNVMTNTGSTALPYEPYNKYKIPVTNAGITTNIYALEPIRKIGDYEDVVGSTGTITRYVKKLVLTGEENIGAYDLTYSRFSIILSDSLVIGVRLSPVVCSHYQGIWDGRGLNDTPNNSIYSDSDSGTGRWFIKTTDYIGSTAYKQYLAQQYANGTPVTIWYVLSTPTTETITSPTISTVSGANTLSIGTTLQPSNVSLTTSSSVYPLNPIIPEEVGDRTGNLCDNQPDVETTTTFKSLSQSTPITQALMSISADTDYTCSWSFDSTSTSGVRNVLRLYDTNTYLGFEIQNGVPFSVPAATLQSFVNSQYPQAVAYFGNAGGTMSEFMLNLGSTALPYEPFGYKIPLNINNTISNIYLSQPIRKIGNYSDIIDYENGTVTRKIKKLVLTGTESYNTYSYQNTNGAMVNTILDNNYSKAMGICTICPVWTGGGGTHCLWIGAPQPNPNKNLYFISILDDLGLQSIPEFVQWVKQQYSSGNPVTVYYVLSTPEVEQITPPTITPSIESNTISVDTTLQPSNLSITYTSPDYSLITKVYDNLGNLLYRDPFYYDWETIRDVVRRGLAPQYYPIGTVFYDNFNPETGTAFQVVAYDNHFDPVLTAQGYTHSMTLCEVLIDDLVTFDATEAFLYTNQALPAGTYKFTIPNYDASYGGNKVYYFTSTAELPENSQIVMNWPYNQTPKTVTGYAPTASLTAMENTTAATGWNALILTEWVDGTSPTATDLGTIAGPTNQAGTSSYGSMNHIHRARYGSNNYLQSGIRQYINSNSAGDQWWQPQTIFDRPYGSRSSNGKLKKLNQGLVGVMAYPAIKSRTNSYFETNSLDGTILTTSTDYDIITDRMFLLSPVEVGFSTTDTTVGTLLDYYVEATNETRIKKRKSNNTAYYWWLRTPYPAHADFVRRVVSSGALDSSPAISSYGSAAACVIQ